MAKTFGWWDNILLWYSLYKKEMIYEKKKNKTCLNSKISMAMMDEKAFIYFLI